MKRLWVYGCSFSEPFGIESGGPEWDETGHRKFKADYWATHLAAKLGLELKAKSTAGIGWNHISSYLEEDIQLWAKKDIIIISPSIFARTTFIETVNPDVRQQLIMELKPMHEVIRLTENRWRKTIENLQHLGYCVYTWSVDETVHTDIKNTLLAPNNDVNWKLWMDQHYEYWTSLPGVVYPLGDWHFNPAGHEAVAEQMYKEICRLQSL